MSCFRMVRSGGAPAAGFTQKLPPTEPVPGQARPLPMLAAARTHDSRQVGATHANLTSHEAAAQKGRVACPG